MTLDELREQWESGLTVIATHSVDQWTFLSVLRDNDLAYHFHRYFIVGDNWTVSVDAVRTTQEAAIQCAFKWQRD